MSKHIDQSELSQIIAKKSSLDPKAIDLFVKHIFAEIESKLCSDSFVKIEGFGTFRIIQSSTAKRILFLEEPKKKKAEGQSKTESNKLFSSQNTNKDLTEVSTQNVTNNQVDVLTDDSDKESTSVIHSYPLIIADETTGESLVVNPEELPSANETTEESLVVNPEESPSADETTEESLVVNLEELPSADEMTEESLVVNPEELPSADETTEESLAVNPEVLQSANDAKKEFLVANSPIVSAEDNEEIESLSTNIVEEKDELNKSDDSTDKKDTLQSREIIARKSVATYRPQSGIRSNSNGGKSQSRSSKRKKKSRTPIFIGVTLVLLFVLGALVYKAFLDEEQTPSEITLKKKSNEPKPVRVSRFAEVVNQDPYNLSCVILVDADISVQDLAKIYYTNELFWPYIYEANSNVIDSKLKIQENSLIKIPKLTVDLVEFSTGILDNKVEAIGNKIKLELGLPTE